MTMTTDKDITTIKVFRESEEWDKVSAWWELAAHKLNSLYIDSWEVKGEVTPKQAEYVRSQYDHPVALVY